MKNQKSNVGKFWDSKSTFERALSEKWFSLNNEFCAIIYSKKAQFAAYIDPQFHVKQDFNFHNLRKIDQYKNDFR